MANENEVHTFRPIHPVRPGSVPTPDGIFPVSATGGGLRRKRKPHIDLALHDVQAKLGDSEDLLEFGWGIIANAHGGNWENASHEWRTAAEKWRDRYFATRKQLEQSPAEPREEPKQVQPVMEPAPVGQVVKDGESLDCFLVRLSALSVEDAKALLPAWDGDDMTFVDAATARWGEATQQPGQAIQSEPSGIPGLLPQTTQPAEDLLDSEFGRWLQGLEPIVQNYYLGDERFALLQAGKLDLRDIGYVSGMGSGQLTLTEPSKGMNDLLIAEAKAWEAAGCQRTEDGLFVIPKKEEPKANQMSRDAILEEDEDETNLPPSEARDARSQDLIQTATTDPASPNADVARGNTDPGPSSDNPETDKPTVEQLVEGLNPQQAETLANVIEGTAHLRENASGGTQGQTEVPPPPPTKRATKSAKPKPTP